MVLFHGAFARFANFDLKYFKSGEGCNGALGFSFSDMRGAVNHALNNKPEAKERLVYVCRLTDDAVVIRRQTPIALQSNTAIACWQRITSIRAIDSGRDWFEALPADADNGHLDHERCDFLRLNGIDAVEDFEGEHHDQKYGFVTLVMNLAKIKIVEVHPAADLISESKKQLRYGLASTEAPLGDTGRLSRLRIITSEE